MAATTEAECLLQSGAAYKRRVGLRREGEPFVFAGFKAGAFSLYQGDLPYVHFDLDGRWQRALIEGVHYLRGLDGAIESMGRNRTPAGLVLNRQRLSFGRSADLDASIRDLALDLLADLAEGRRDRVEPPSSIQAIANPELRAMLEAIAAWDADAWQRQRERYGTCYDPHGFLPPSAPNALILQATVGGEPGAVGTLRTPSEFREHLGHVAGLYGRRAAQARGVVLAAGDLLRHPAAALLPLLRIVADEFPAAFSAAIDEPDGLRLKEVVVYLDAPTGAFPDRAGLDALQAAGLRRVDLGVPNWRVDLSTRTNGLADRLTDLKAAGIPAGVVIPVGGVEIIEAAESLGAWLLDLPLGTGDVVYLVDAAELTPAVSDHSASDEIARDLRAWLAPIAREGGFKLVPYRPEKQ